MLICAINGMSLRGLEQKFKIRNGGAWPVLRKALGRWQISGVDFGV